MLGIRIRPTCSSLVNKGATVLASARMKGNEQESTKAGTALFIIVCINDGLAALTPNQIVFTILVDVAKSASSIFP